jgi:hypothetical protein
MPSWFKRKIKAQKKKALREESLLGFFYKPVKYDPDRNEPLIILAA